MKDLEKIQSPDLACQVQDANPGNFAIEQEVGAMVGATVPAPTEPSADDARELGAQLLVFLRRALLPIKSALRTALADIYSHLDSRCTDYTPAAYAPFRILPYDPMGSTPRTLPNLLTAITAFASRKISNGSAPNDGIPDGVSLARLICDTTATNAVLELKDDNYGYTINMSRLKTLMDMLTNVVTATINGTGQLTCHVVNNDYVGTIYNRAKLETLNMPEVTSANTPSAGSDGTTMPACIMSNPKLATIYAPKIDVANVYGNGNQYSAFISNCPALKEVTLGKVRNSNQSSGSGWGGTKHIIQYCTALEKISVEDLDVNNCLVRSGQNENLIYLQIRGIQANSCNLSWWNPTDKGTTFLQNFLEHICKNLANRTGQTKLTLTLSAAVYTAIMTDNDIKAELVARNWKVTDGTNNYNN